MADLSTQYMGLEMRNPIVVASCSFGNSSGGVRKCAEAGAGAIVLKSLFEEQMRASARELEEHSWLSGHTEAFEYVSKIGLAVGPRQYLRLIEDCKESVDIPVIASLNCITPKWWTDYAREIAAAGADGLELNIAVMPSDPNRTSREVEQLYFTILEGVKEQVEIPIAVKIGPHFTSIGRMAWELSRRGASALVFFNRFYRFDIDVEKLELAQGEPFSSPEETTLPLRWIALLSGRVKSDLAASTGVHDGAGIVKHLLAGASAVQVCSVLYLEGLDQIGQMLGDVESWLGQHGFGSVEEIRGRFRQMQSDRPELYERLQYIRALAGEG
jgi:dihydroorotate dehydrogenase (fumarate)